MSKSLYIINPASVHPHYSSYEVYQALGLRPVIFTADQSTTTLAAMAPEDFHLALCDETVSLVDYETDADYICITGRISQWERMKEHAAAFRSRGKTVIMGGPHVTLAPETARPHCDILVRGEIEEIYPDIFSDLRSGSWKEEYIGGRPDLSLAVIPKFEIYPNGHTFLGSLQTSRGCPFQCEFCSVTQYNGRHQRHKPIPTVLKELDNLYDIGYRNVFITDDNFSAHHEKAREILSALTFWNDKRTKGGVSFVAQVSVDSAKDGDMLGLLAGAGVTDAFVGIETMNQESLKETKKLQNLNVDFKECIDLFLHSGICVQGGLIAGFDSDRPDVFSLIFEFASELPIPYYNLDSLVALPGTPLHKRMEQENRLLCESETSGLPWTTNFIPRQMTHEQLRDGMKWLCSNLYHPRRFEDRIRRFVDAYKPVVHNRNKEGEVQMDACREKRYNRFHYNANKLISHISELGDEESAMMTRLMKLAEQKPKSADRIRSFVHDYAQTRHLYAYGDFYDENLADIPFETYLQSR
jgi:radical SAM superfamily enzyme YgiQ (UPF0313 family)